MTEEKRIAKRTPIIEFQRQLLPQPPRNAEPYFCLINTLIFYELDENGRRILNDDKQSYKEAWRQQIPEVDLLGFQREDTSWSDLEHRHGQHCIRVEYEENFGWILKFSIAHENAKRIWKVLFPQVNFDREI